MAVFQVFSKMHGIRFLWDVLGSLLLELDALSKGTLSTSGKIGEDRTSLFTSSIEMEVDPNKMEEGQLSSINKYTLLLTSQKLFAAMVKSVPHIPFSIRAVLHDVSESVGKKYPDNVRLKAIGGFFFLRFIVPSISAPHIYGLYAEPPNETTQRNLVLLSKVLQNLANGIPFGDKEQYMAPMNSFITDNLPILHKFFEKASSIETPTDGPHAEDIEDGVPGNVVKNAIFQLHSFLCQNIDRVTEELKIAGQLQLANNLNDFIKKSQPPAKLVS